jgi:hypothetical protein
MDWSEQTCTQPRSPNAVGRVDSNPKSPPAHRTRRLCARRRLQPPLSEVHWFRWRGLVRKLLRVYGPPLRGIRKGGTVPQWRVVRSGLQVFALSHLCSGSGVRIEAVCHLQNLQ